VTKATPVSEMQFDGCLRSKLLYGENVVIYLLFKLSRYFAQYSAGIVAGLLLQCYIITINLYIAR
jgi:hypothetical protein